MKLSIIIPVYNKEKYLTSCLESVCNQNLESGEYEVIVVNDGSVDGSEKIIKEFKNRYSNIIYISQPNQGVSSARNKGLETAKGDYITFVDADDEIYKNAVREIVDYAVKNNLDLLYPHIEYINSKGEKTGEFKMDTGKSEILDGFSHQRRGYIVGIYKRSVLSCIRFNTEIPIAEDSLFNIEVHSVAKRVSYLGNPFYRYRKGIHSLSNSKAALSGATFDGALVQLRSIYDLIQRNKNQWSENQIKYFDRPYFITTELITNVNIKPSISFTRFIKLKKELKKLNIEYISDEVSKTIPYFNSNPVVFFCYHSPKVIRYRFKVWTFRQLEKIGIVKQ